jgi:hypothetical protein
MRRPLTLSVPCTFGHGRDDREGLDPFSRSTNINGGLYFRLQHRKLTVLSASRHTIVFAIRVLTFVGLRRLTGRNESGKGVLKNLTPGRTECLCHYLVTLLIFASVLKTSRVLTFVRTHELGMTGILITEFVTLRLA